VAISNADASVPPIVSGPTATDGSFDLLIPVSAPGYSDPTSGQVEFQLLSEQGAIESSDGPTVSLTRGSQSIGTEQLSYDSDNDGDDDSDGTDSIPIAPVPQMKSVRPRSVRATSSAPCPTPPRNPRRAQSRPECTAARRRQPPRPPARSSKLIAPPQIAGRHAPGAACRRGDALFTNGPAKRDSQRAGTCWRRFMPRTEAPDGGLAVTSGILEIRKTA